MRPSTSWYDDFLRTLSGTSATSLAEAAPEEKRRSATNRNQDDGIVTLREAAEVAPPDVAHVAAEFDPSTWVKLPKNSFCSCAVCILHE